MKKSFFIIIIIFILSFLCFSQAIDPTTDIDKEIDKIKSEIATMKKDIEILKERTEWFSFRVSGYIKSIYGVALWSKRGSGFDSNAAITHGFDFDNKIRLQMLLGNKVIATSSSMGDLGSEVNIELRIKSRGVSEIKPEGSWYVVKGKDDQDNTVDIYMQRNERDGSNIIFGNFEVILHEAQVKNILGTGFFVNYRDVQEVHQYYGITGLVDVLTLNHDYLNNGFVLDKNDYDKFATTYYSFDPEDYEPESHTAEAMKLWSYSMLHTDPNDDDYNQKPHGISGGFSKNLTDGFDFFLELGASSKDAFDPKYYEDNNLDYGFFIKTEPRFYNDKIEFHPKLAASFAFQTGTTDDLWWAWSTFAGALSIPVQFNLSSSKKDFIKLETNFNLNVHIVTNQLATIVSFISDFTLLKGKLNLSFPLIYSFKNAGRSGFQRVGHEDVYWLDQLYDDHILNIGFNIGFDSLKLFGDVFQYKVTNKFYFTYILEYDNNNYAYNYLNHFSGHERYIHDIIRNEFILNYLGPEKLVFYVEHGLCHQNNARMVDSSTQFKYTYDRNTDSWVDTMENELMSWERWPNALILSAEVGFYADIFKNLSVGLSAESPKLLLNPPTSDDIIGNQQTYGIFKLWSKINF
ncbi:MAG: hypothetical protein JXA99_04215 [Candidatus Lokiarchaeota archaeon]|nr:hypothetical protein [Candidatus Lokiarchaeota archaeon]